MLDSYSEKQPIIYKILSNSITKKKLSHAYLFESNGNNGQAYKMAMAFAKSLLCPYNYMNFNKCLNCTQCLKIDKNEFSELNVIEPDGMWIKKEQLEILQKNFETKAIESDKRIYIINNADKMNASAANSILKFLEEPEADIIAILIADNRYQLLETIVSRCQIINFNTKNTSDNWLSAFKMLISNNELEEQKDDILCKLIDDAIKFVNYYESHKLDTLLYVDKYFHNIFNTKNFILFAFDTMILYYKDVMKQLCNLDNILFIKHAQLMEEVMKKNNIESILYKINVLIELKKKIYLNANTNLLVDRLIIELSKGD